MVLRQLTTLLIAVCRPTPEDQNEGATLNIAPNRYPGKQARCHNDISTGVFQAAPKSSAP